jgi:hypothetical protein
MHSPESHQSGKISLEALLQLKRVERPTPEFWERFEADLRTKQLAAIVEKRPWWVAFRLPHGAALLARWQVPALAGAASLLVVSVVGVRAWRPVAAAPQERVVASTPVAAVVTKTVAAMPVQLEASALAVAPVIEMRLPAPTPAVVEVAREESRAAGAVQVAAEVPRAPIAPAMEVAAKDVAQASSALVSVTLPAQVVEPVNAVELPEVVFAEGVQAEQVAEFGGGFQAESGVISADSALPSKVRALPIALGEGRRGRILAGMLVADNKYEGDRAAMGQGREIHSANWIEEASSDRLGRLGMGGDRLILKF